MRLTLLFPILFLLACADAASVSEAPYESVRDRLEHDAARLFVAPERSAGSIRAERLAGEGWETGLVDLHVDSGELALRAAGNAILIERFALGLAPIEVPASVTGHRAQLVDVRAELAQPVLAPAVWDDDDEAHVSTRVQLELSWALRVDEVELSLGAPTLPPLPLELTLTGTGEIAHAEVRMLAAGEIWSWADLVRLVDLFVLVSADG